MRARYLFETEEHESLRKQAGRFAREHIAPHAFAWEEAGEFPPFGVSRRQLRRRALCFSRSHWRKGVCAAYAPGHALAIGLFALQHPASFAAHVRSMSVGPGIIVHAFIAVLAASSNDRAVR
jgi:alkylation response protein AidB-like acyl-CoA dehydrogenase